MRCESEIVKVLRDEERSGKLKTPSKSNILNISEQNKDEKNNISSNLSALFKFITENTFNALIQSNNSGRIIYASQSCKQVLGYNPDELLNRKFLDFIEKKELSRMKPKVKEILSGKKLENFETIFVRNDGKSIPVELFGTAIQEGKKVYINIVLRDISERKRLLHLMEQSQEDLEKRVMEQTTKLRKTLERNKLIFENTSDYIATMTFSINPVFTYVSPSHFRILGYSPEEIIGKSIFSFIHPEDNKKILSIIRKYVGIKAMKVLLFEKENISEQFEFRFRGKDNSWRYIETTANIIGNEILTISKDVTESKKAQKDLNESERRLRNVLEGSPIPSFFIDKDHTVVYWNKALENLSGIKAKEVIGTDNHWTAFYKENRPCIADLIVDNRTDKIDDLYKGKYVRCNLINQAFEAVDFFPVIGDQGKWLRFTAAPMKDGSGELIGALETLEDINESKIAENKLKESEEKFRNLSDLLPVVVFETDANGNLTYVNRQSSKITGHTVKDFQKNFHIFDFFIPEDKEKAKNKLEEMLKYESTEPQEYTAKRKDGENFPVLLYSSPIVKDGLTIGIRGILVDITNQKMTENQLKNAHKQLKKLNLDLEKKVQQRTIEVENLLRQKDEFINQLGHDLKNPLNPLMNLVPLLAKDEVSPDRKEIFDVVTRNISYMKNLVIKTIKLARLNSPNNMLDFKDTNLSEVITMVLEKNKISLEDRRISVENYVETKLSVKADMLHLEELIDNIISNAVKYSPENSCIVLNAETDGDFAVVSVSDGGIGMTEKQIAYVFDEFYKADISRHDFESSGLGLPICKRIVEKHGGKIWAESKGEGKGTTLYFTMPLSKKA